MSGQEALVRKEGNRYQIIKLFYDELGSEAGRMLDSRRLCAHLAAQGDMSNDEASSAIQYLVNEGLLKRETMDGATSITILA